MKQCILFNSCILNEETLFRYRLLKENIQCLDIDIIWAYDYTKNDIDFPNDIIVWKFCKNDINDKTIAFAIEDKDFMWLNANNYLILNFFKKFPYYDVFWHIEYDVGYSGNWKDFFIQMNSIVADFISYNFIKYPTLINWPWWNKINSKELKNKEWYGSFNPICRLNRIAVDSILELLKNENENKRLFSEVSFLTAIRRSNLIAYDMKEKKCSNHFSCNIFNIDTNNICQKNKLYHPIKDNIKYSNFLEIAMNSTLS